MLLHRLYINMVIANNLVYPKSLYYLPGPKHEIRILRESQEKGRGHMGMMPDFARLSPGLNLFYRPYTTPIQSIKAVASCKMTVSALIHK